MCSGKVVLPQNLGFMVAGEATCYNKFQRMAGTAPLPRLLVVAGPSGVGKGTLLKRLQERFPNAFGFSVSYTSRQQRPGTFIFLEYTLRVTFFDSETNYFICSNHAKAQTHMTLAYATHDQFLTHQTCFQFELASVQLTPSGLLVGEQHGVHYMFVDKPTFENGITENLFIEYTKTYGTLFFHSMCCLVL